MIVPTDYRLGRTLSTFDVPDNFVLSYHYELPFPHLFGRNRLARGWIVSGITRFADRHSRHFVGFGRSFAFGHGQRRSGFGCRPAELCAERRFAVGS